jgi:tetratricopeptide (TPR) repeat protein
MKLARLNLYGIAFLSFTLSLMAAGCATVAYTPTQDNVPKISYSDAGKKLMALKGSRIYTDKRYFNIADVKISSDSVDIIFKKRNFLNIETGDTDKQTIHLKSLKVPSVSTQKGNSAYFMKFLDGRMLLFRNENEAVSCANALFILKRHAEGYSPPKDAAAEAAFQDEARKYREMPVKPVLPEKAHKYAVQGDFAVEKKNLAAAVDHYAEALKVAPWWPEGHFKRGLILADIERYDEAIEEMKKFLLLAPDAKEARAAQDNIYKWESVGSWAGLKTTSRDVPSEAQTSENTDGTNTFTGTVKRVISTNPLWYGSSVWCMIEVGADNGDKSTFIVFKTTTINDTDGKKISTIKRNKRAEIKYSIITDGNKMTNGKNKAISIRYLD